MTGRIIALVWKHLEGVGLSMEAMAFEMTSTDFEKVAAQDLADAQTLKVTKTPEFFVNGRPLPSFGVEQLQSFVDDALAAAR
jgi:protein-disulfide isomerase